MDSLSFAVSIKGFEVPRNFGYVSKVRKITLYFKHGYCIMHAGDIKYLSTNWFTYFLKFPKLREIFCMILKKEILFYVFQE